MQFRQSLVLALAAALAACGGPRETDTAVRSTEVAAAAQTVASFPLGKLNYTIASTPSGHAVADKVTGITAVTAPGVSQILFADSAVFFDAGGVEGQAYRLYRAAFARKPDMAGLGFQIDAVKRSGLAAVAQSFLASPEFQSTYGNVDDSQFVTMLYQNVLHRAPDAAGLQFYLGELSTTQTRSDVLVQFSESPENQANVLPEIQQGVTYVPPGLAGFAGADEPVQASASLPEGKLYYTIARTASGYSATEKVTANATAIPAGVSRMFFADSAVFFDPAGPEGKTYRLYQAAFARKPDMAGLGFQIDAVEKTGLRAVAQSFLASPEFQSTYGNVDDTQFVTMLYQNVLHRAPDAGGLQFYVGALATTATRADVLVQFSESPENQANALADIQGGVTYFPLGLAGFFGPDDPVQDGTIPNFALAVSGTASVSEGGASAPITVTVMPTNGFSGSVTISITGLPAGASTAPFPLTVAAGSTQQFTITVPAGTPTGPVPIVVTGASGTLTHRAEPATLTTTAAATPSGFQFNGIHMSTYTRGAFKTADFQFLLQNMADMNVNYVGIGTAYQVDLATGGISDYTGSGPDATESMANIESAIAAAQAKGFNVFLKPNLLSADAGSGNTDNITFTAPSDIPSFFANYKALLLQWAALAQKYHVPLMAIGNEMAAVSKSQYIDYWNDIIASIRAVYAGKLTYSALPFIYGPTYDELENIQFWGKLDYIGVSAYTHFATGLQAPTVAQCDAGWDQWRDRIGAVAAATGKHVIFTESGAASYLGYFDPAYGAAADAQSGTVDFATQANFYQSFADTWTGANRPSWLEGVFFWNEDPGIVGRYLFQDGHTEAFQVIGKPAGTLVASLFGGNAYLDPLAASVTGGTGNDSFVLYGDAPAPSAATEREQTYTTNVSLVLSANIINGNTPTLHVFINGSDYGQLSPEPIPGGYVDSKGIAFTTQQRFSFKVPGLVAITQLKVAFDSAVDLGGPETSVAAIDQVTVDGIPLTSALYTPDAQYGQPQQQALPRYLGPAEWAVQGGGGFTVFDATPYNQALANLPGSSGNPIVVEGGGGSDTVHVLGNRSQYTVSGIGTGAVTLTENSGLDQNATLHNVSFLSFPDGSVLDLATGALH